MDTDSFSGASKQRDYCCFFPNSLRTGFFHLQKISRTFLSTLHGSQEVKKTMVKVQNYKKKLEGVKVTEDLQALFQIALNLASTDVLPNIKDTASSGSSAVSRACAVLPTTKATSILKGYNDELLNNRDVEPKEKKFLSLDVVKAMRSMFVAASDSKRMTELETAINKTTLVFTSPPSENEEDSKEKQKFRKRLERLKLLEESNQYKKMMANLDNTVEDDVTTKSMTYAASVGLNMIVAPISFGVLMYFFAGQIFTWIADDDESATTANHHRILETRRLIAGVVSGVAMLFIEMILFVIRTHEFDKAMSKKKRKKTPSPFGYTKPKA